MTTATPGAKVQCKGTGQPAIENPDPDKWPYPTCPVCLRDFSVSGKRGHPHAWESIPRHFVTEVAEADDGPPVSVPLRVEYVDGEHVPRHPEECEPHTDSPTGYVAWDQWAEHMQKTHDQRQCKGCGLWAIWEPKAEAAP